MSRFGAVGEITPPLPGLFSPRLRRAGMGRADGPGLQHPAPAEHRHRHPSVSAHGVRGGRIQRGAAGARWGFVRLERRDALRMLLLVAALLCRDHSVHRAFSRAAAGRGAGHSGRDSAGASQGYSQLPLALLFGLTAGYREEFFFRAYLLTRLDELALPVPYAVAASTALFCVGHVYEGVMGVLVAAGLGVLFASVYLRRKEPPRDRSRPWPVQHHRASPGSAASARFAVRPSSCISSCIYESACSSCSRRHRCAHLVLVRKRWNCLQGASRRPERCTVGQPDRFIPRGQPSG